MSVILEQLEKLKAIFGEFWVKFTTPGAFWDFSTMQLVAFALTLIFFVNMIRRIFQAFVLRKAGNDVFVVRNKRKILKNPYLYSLWMFVKCIVFSGVVLTFAFTLSQYIIYFVVGGVIVFIALVIIDKLVTPKERKDINENV